MRTNALVLILAAMPFTACKCKNGLNGTDGALIASPQSAVFGPQGIGSTKTIFVSITNQGDAPVDISQQPSPTTNPHGAYSAQLAQSDGGLIALPITLDIGEATGMTVTYAPKAEENDDGGVVTVFNDSPANLLVPVSGAGVDPCYNVVCDAGVAGIGSNPGGCYGSCDESNGKCVYNGACSDKSQCLSNGTCNPSTGACQGTSDCEQAGAGTCSGNVLTGDVAPGSCDQGTGTCLYNHQTVTCDCACVQSGSSASCTYQWQPVQGVPTGQASSVWSAGQTAGDLWLSVINGTSSQFNQNTVYHQVGGAWSQVGQVANGASPLCSGPGCGLALVGSSDNDVYGTNDCITVQGGQCTAGGAWHFTGTAADESFPSLGNVGPDLPLTTLIDIGGTAFALNSDDQVGPEIIEGNAGTWKVLFPAEWKCQSQGAIWGTSATDLWLSWGCNGVNPGQLAHYNGSSLDTPVFTLPAGEYAEGMWGTSDTDIWAAGTHRWHYNGTAWTIDPVAPPAGNADQTVWGNGSDYFAGGGYIALYHWTSANDWTEECIAPGYSDPSVYSFASDGTNFYATTSATSGPGLVERCTTVNCQ